MEKNKKKRRTILAVILAVAIIMIIILLLLKECSNSIPDPGGETQESYYHITYKGKEYTYNSRILTVMYAGVDSDGDLTTYNRYSIAPRADTIELVIFDDYHKKISILAISRDTITSVARYTMNGNYRDNYDTNLGYAYTYGDGGKVSCTNLMDSVSGLLKNVPIHEYVITGNSSIVELNRAVGGVTVTVPNDDLAHMYPELVSGAVVQLTEENVDAFVRFRDTTIPFTNNGRMERQKVFSTAFLKKFMDMASSDREGTWSLIEEESQSYQTSITRNQYLELVDRIDTETFDGADYYILEGENVFDAKNHIDKFYVDEDNLMETIIELFYLEEDE